MAKWISYKKKSEMLSKFDSRCAYCGCCVTIDTVVADHIVPRKEKGGNGIDNLNPSCISCNCSKRDRSIEMFRVHMAIKNSRFKGVISASQWCALVANGASVDIGDYEFYFERHKKAPR